MSLQKQLLRTEQRHSEPAMKPSPTQIKGAWKRWLESPSWKGGSFPDGMSHCTGTEVKTEVEELIKELKELKERIEEMEKVQRRSSLQ